MSVLKAKKLSKSYSQRLVVKELCLEAESGRIIGLLGRNGAGKTTTFQMIAGLIKPDSGNIYLDEKNISRYPSCQRAQEGITYLPQESSVFLKTSVMGNLKIVLELQGYNKEKQQEIATQLLDELGLSPLAKQPAYSLSGGERRRLEICRSLILEPKFLLLDEPFTGVDPLTILELQKIMKELKNKGIGILISDHNVRDTFKISDHVYIIDDGSMLIQGNPKEIASDETAKEKFLGKNFRFGKEIDYDLSRGNK